jgi:hypothetical protein
MSLCGCPSCSALPISPVNPRFHLAPTGAAPIYEWGASCGRGWVRDDRFGSGQVIKGTNRNKTRQMYRTKGARL